MKNKKAFVFFSLFLAGAMVWGCSFSEQSSQPSARRYLSKASLTFTSKGESSDIMHSLIPDKPSVVIVHALGDYSIELKAKDDYLLDGQPFETKTIHVTASGLSAKAEFSISNAKSQDDTTKISLVLDYQDTKSVNDKILFQP